MTKPRVIETNVGIQGEIVTADYDVFARGMRDKGWLETGKMFKAGITGGKVLEVGPGPGYVGLEWLKRAKNAHLTGFEISRDMICIAQKNLREYGFSENVVSYVQGNAMAMPFADGMFDAAFSNGSLHEWEDPMRVFSEIYRILKCGGRFVVSDLRRDISFGARLFMKAGTKPRCMRTGLNSSLNAAYTAEELREIMNNTDFQSVMVSADAYGLAVTGVKL
jgi:ubiquinone/menaquinone biosynthesis C-methylase UbiE